MGGVIGGGGWGDRGGLQCLSSCRLCLLLVILAVRGLRPVLLVAIVTALRLGRGRGLGRGRCGDGGGEGRGEGGEGWRGVVAALAGVASWRGREYDTLPNA